MSLSPDSHLAAEVVGGDEETFFGRLAASSNATAATFTNVFTMPAANVSINNGGFTVVPATAAVGVPSAGRYQVDTLIDVAQTDTTSSNQRVHVNIRLAVIRGGVTTPQAGFSTGYLRAQYPGFETAAINLYELLDLEAGDQVITQLEASIQAGQMDITGGFMSLVKVNAGGGGADNFVGARAGISPARTGQDYGILTTLTWDVEEFDVGGFFDPATNSRMTVPSGVTYAVVHGGVTLGGFANTGDLFIDILENGVSLGIGSTTKNIGISTVARTSVTTGVVEVEEGDYFELAIRVIQDGSVTLQPLGTFFSCHASSTEIGGSSPDTNDYVSSIDFGLSGQDVTLTLDRTGALPSISGTFTLPAGSGGGITEMEADARYLPLTGGTLAGPGRLTIDVNGNSEALVINHHGGLSESALHAFTNTTGAQKAMQASRSNQSTAWFSIEGSLGGGNTKPGIAFGGGTGARDTELYRDSASNWKTPDWFTAQGFSITGAALSTWNSFGIANVLDGPPTLSGTDLTFTELDGTQTVIALPATGTGTDRYVTGIVTAIDSNNSRRFTIQVTRNDGLPALTTTHTVPNETPTGGAAGWLLGKATAADHDFEYIDPSGLITPVTVFPSVNTIIEQGTGITITRDATNNAIRIASDTAPWALIANTDVIVPGKLGSGVTSPDVVLYGDGAWKALPTLLDDISDWAHQANTDVIPIGKLGSGVTNSTTVLYGDGAFRVPAFLTAAGVYDWAEEGNVDRLPIDKMPSVLRTVSHFTYDTAIAAARHVLHEHGGDK